MGEFHQKLLQSFTNFKNKYLKAADGLVFKFTKDPGGSGKYGYLNSNGEFVPFKTAHTLTRTITAGTSSKTTDMGEDHEYRYVVTKPTPSQTKTVTGSRSAQTVTPDSGYLLSSVTVNKYPDATGTYGTITTNGTHDMGTTNNYRYVGVNVPISAVSGPIQAVHDGVDRSYSSWITVSSWSKYRGFAVCAYAGNGVGGVSWGTISSNGTVTYSSKSQYTDVEVSGNKIRGHQSIMSNVGVFLIVF